MKQLNYIIALTLLSILLSLNTHAQEILEKADAVSIALENNYDIRVARNDLEVAKNNSQLTNSGYLPSVSGSAGANYSINDQEITSQQGDLTSVSGIETKRYNAGISLDYTVFNGMGRKYSYAKLKENYNLSDLQARSVMENTLVNIFNSYYEIARLSQNILNQSQTLDISRERLLRAKYSFDYGQNTQLDVLNAEVDYNTDSISYLNLSQQFYNEKHNLNLLLGRDVSTPFTVDTTLVFTDGLQLITLMDKATTRNVVILQQEGNIRNASSDIKVNSSSRIPIVGVNAGYSWQNNILGPTSFLAEQTSTGLGLNATLSWNIWDGGITNTRRQNSKVALKNQQLVMQQAQLNLERNVSNAWTNYQTALFVMQAQQTNLRTNQRNFNRTEEQFKLGQITSIEFRQAQLNLLTAQLNYSQARYSAKITELALLQLSGDILNAQF